MYLSIFDFTKCNQNWLCYFKQSEHHHHHHSFVCVGVCGFFSPFQKAFNTLWWQTSAKNGETESTSLVDVTCYILWGFFPTVIYDFWHLNCVGHYHFIVHALLRKNCMAKHLKDSSQVYSLGYGIIFIVIKILKTRRSNHLNTKMFLL